MLPRVSMVLKLLQRTFCFFIAPAIMVKDIVTVVGGPDFSTRNENEITFWNERNAHGHDGYNQTRDCEEIGTVNAKPSSPDNNDHNRDSQDRRDNNEQCCQRAELKRARLGARLGLTKPSRDFWSPSRARAEPSLSLEVNEPSRADIPWLGLKPSRAEPEHGLGSGLAGLARGSLGSVKCNEFSACSMCYKSLLFSVTMMNVGHVLDSRETSGVMEILTSRSTQWKCYTNCC